MLSVRGGFLALLACLQIACVHLPSPVERRAQADALAARQSWLRVELQGDAFDLVGYAPQRVRPGKELTVYIEGDGLAWISASQPSFDPTPRNPLALQLALAQPDGNAAYLARPCQYGAAQADGCAQRYWTGARFAEEVIVASNQALDALKARFAAQRLVLVGYSGGGAVASLLAARRDDVRLLVTVAGNLDHRAWTEQQRVSPLRGSLNPADFRAQLRGVRQWHLSGDQDRVVPSAIASDFIAGLPQPNQAQLLVMPAFDHQCCWVQRWAELWPQLSAP